MAEAKHDPLHYLQEIRNNVAKLKSQKQVTPAENALFGMIDGLAGLNIFLMEQMGEMRKRLDALEGAQG